METYIKNYNNFNKNLVYNFNLGSGGIADCMKFFMVILSVCMKHQIKLFYLINNTPLERYLKLKYKEMYICKNVITNSTELTDPDISNLEKEVYYTTIPNVFYNCYKEDYISVPFQDVFYFTDAVISKSEAFCNYTNYISLHLRLGDKFLETDRNFKTTPEDTRYYDEGKIHKFIEDNKENNIVFFCDNNSYKIKLKAKYSNLITLESEIGHTGLVNTTNEQVLDTAAEFFIMTKSKYICSASESGFSTIAAKFNNIQLTKL